MLGSTIEVTINAVAKTLNRINDSEPYSAVYYLEDGTVDYTVTIKHTVPASRGSGKESHLVRLDVNTYDEDNVLLRKQSVWVVAEASFGRQDTTTLNYAAQGLFGFLDSTDMAKVLGRQS